MPLTVDTRDDYDRVKDLFEHLFAQDQSFSTEAIRIEGLSRYAGVPNPDGSH